MAAWTGHEEQIAKFGIRAVTGTRSPVDHIVPSLTAAQKKLLKTEYKKAAARMHSGVSPAWGRAAVRALKSGAIGAEGRRKRPALASRPMAPHDNKLSWSFAAAGAFVACFACVLGVRPGDRPIAAEIIDASKTVGVEITSTVAEFTHPQTVVPVKVVAVTGGGHRGADAFNSDDAPVLPVGVEPLRGSPAPTPSIELRPNVSLAASTDVIRPATVGAPELRKTSFVGVWGGDSTACSSQNKRRLIPTIIDQEGARAGETVCKFEKMKEVADGWKMVASCSNPRERWTSNVQLKLRDDRLTWTSKRGSQSYVRCSPGVIVAQIMP
jgi:hypothetical protein